MGRRAPLSEETKRKISEIHKGKPRWPNGRKFDQGFRDKISKAKKGKPWTDKQREAMKMRWVKRSHPMLGRHHSAASKELMSKSKAELITAGKFTPYNKDCGEFWSIKNNKTLYYRSHLELSAFKTLELLDHVVSYDVEPFSIPYEFDGCERQYVPDLLVKYSHGTIELIEIKPENMIDFPMNKAKALAAQRYCHQRGMIYSIWSRKHLIQ